MALVRQTTAQGSCGATETSELERDGLSAVHGWPEDIPFEARTLAIDLWRGQRHRDLLGAPGGDQCGA